MDDKVNKKVLFLCTQNSARSQMAEALLNNMYPDRYEAFSAGTHPSKVNPYAVEAMRRLGIDISNHRSKSIEEFKDHEFDYVITVCDNARENCPYFPGKMVIHQSFPDPASKKGTDHEILAEFIKVRDQIKEWIEKKLGSSE